MQSTAFVHPSHHPLLIIKVPEAPAVHIDDVYITGILRYVPSIWKFQKDFTETWNQICIKSGKKPIIIYQVSERIPQRLDLVVTGNHNMYPKLICLSKIGLFQWDMNFRQNANQIVWKKSWGKNHWKLIFSDKAPMCPLQCSPPIPGSTLPYTPMLSTSVGRFLPAQNMCWQIFSFVKLLQFVRFLTWAFHIFLYDIAYEPEGWPWKPVYFCILYFSDKGRVGRFSRTFSSISFYRSKRCQ